MREDKNINKTLPVDRGGEADHTGGLLSAAQADGAAHVGEGGRATVAERLVQGQRLVVQLLQRARLGVRLTSTVPHLDSLLIGDILSRLPISPPNLAIIILKT